MRYQPLSMFRVRSNKRLHRFLALVPLFDSDPQLRISTTVLSVVAVALLTVGFASTALLCFACRIASFQAEAVFL